MALLEIDELQARAILDMQLRGWLPSSGRSSGRARRADGPHRRLQRHPRQRGPRGSIVGEELAEIVEKYGDARRTRIVAAEGEMSMEDLIAEEDVVVTITRGGYVKRTKVDLYRSQRRGGKGVRGAR